MDQDKLTAPKPLSEWPEATRQNLIRLVVFGNTGEGEEDRLPDPKVVPRVAPDLRERLIAVFAQATESKTYQTRTLGQIIRMLPDEYRKQVADIRQKEGREPVDISNSDIPCMQLYLIMGKLEEALAEEQVSASLSSMARYATYGVFHTDPADPANWNWPDVTGAYEKVVDMLARFEDYKETEKE